MPMDLPVTLHDDEIAGWARERMGEGELAHEYGGHYRWCPGCDLLVHHSDLDDHAGRCVALKALVIWEAGAHRPPKAAIHAAGA